MVAVEQGYMKQQLVESNTRRVEAIERGEQTVVGVNRFIETEPSPLAGAADAILTVSPQAEAEQIERLEAWRSARDQKAVIGGAEGPARGGQGEPQHHAGLDRLRQSRRHHRRMGFCTRARASASIARRPASAARHATRPRASTTSAPTSTASRASSAGGSKFVVGKPGLDGHSNGAEQIAVRARDAGMDVVYQGIRLTPAEIVEAAREQGAHVVGLSILSGSHLPLVTEVVARMKTAGLDDVPVVVGGIIPPDDAQALQQAGVAAVYTPKDFELNRIMADVVRIVEEAAAEKAA